MVQTWSSSDRELIMAEDSSVPVFVQSLHKPAPLYQCLLTLLTFLKHYQVCSFHFSLCGDEPCVTGLSFLFSLKSCLKISIPPELSSLQTINYKAQLIVWRFQIQVPFEPWGEKHIVLAVRYCTVHWLAPKPQVLRFANMFFSDRAPKKVLLWQSPQNLP